MYDDNNVNTFALEKKRNMCLFKKKEIHKGLKYDKEVYEDVKNDLIQFYSHRMDKEPNYIYQGLFKSNEARVLEVETRNTMIK